MIRQELVEEDAEAYKSYVGKDIVTTTANAVVEWIKAINEELLDCRYSDTTIAENVASRGRMQRPRILR
jgi:hypothetical protein